MEQTWEKWKKLTWSDAGGAAVLAWLGMNFLLGSFFHAGDIQFVGEGSLVKSVLVFLLLWMFFLAGEVYGGTPFKAAVLGGLVLAAAVAAIWKKNDYFSVGLGTLILLCFLCQKREFWKDVAAFQCPLSIVKWIYLTLFLFLAIYIGAVTVCRYLAFRSPTFDMGIFSQMFESMRRTGIPYTTCERNELLSHFLVHPSYVFYLVLPIYMLAPSPATVQIIQALVVASGLVPVYLLAKKRGLPSAAIIFLGLLYVGMPGLSGSCFYDFHENCFLAPGILWLVLAMEGKRWWCVIPAALLMWSIKEDAGIYTAFIGLYFLLSGRQKKRGAVMFIASCAVFAFINHYLSQTGYGVADVRYQNLVLDKDGSMYQILQTAWFHAGYLLQECLDLEKIWYLIVVTLPAFPLIFRRKDWSAFLLLGPMALLNLMPDYAYMHSVNYQYNFGNSALLLYFVLICLDHVEKEDIVRFAAAAAGCALVLLSGLKLWRLDLVKEWWGKRREYEHLDNVLQAIPEDASVTASTYLTAHLYKHEELYPMTSGKVSEYLVRSLMHSSTVTEEFLLEHYDYEEFYYEEGLVAIYKLAE